MKISTRARYGTRAMLELALHYGSGTVMVRDIAERQKLSARYLEQLMVSLKVAGLVRSTRGTHGGFSLAKPPSEITLLNIVEIMDGSVAPVGCVDEPDFYSRVPVCAAHDVWFDVKKSIERSLSSVTLQDLVDKQLAKEAEYKKEHKNKLLSEFAGCGDRQDGCRNQ
jgi:Rrf2 family transcriptional regulator, cysteine metabolism repressor